MAEPILEPERFAQVAIVVPDIEAAATVWSRLLGVDIPAWSLTAPAAQTNIDYRGQTTEGRAKLAFFTIGNIRLELIEPVGGPSTWQEFLDKHGPGIHHIAFNVTGMDEVIRDLEDVGLETVQRGDYKGGRYAYVEGYGAVGAVLELLESFGR